MGMTNEKGLPHHKLLAYEMACELLKAVQFAAIADPKLRDQALRAAKSACLNIAEAAARVGSADQKRVFAIARAEACEAACAVEVGSLAGDCSPEAAVAARESAGRAYALLTGLIRKP
jgi:four helix bundle protein